MNVTTVLVCISLLVHMAICEQIEYRLACYVTSDTHSLPALASLDQTDPHLCTHVIYASMDIDQDYNIKPFSQEDASAWSLLRKLKEGNPDLKTLLSTGRWTSTDTRLVEMASDHSSLKMFVDSAVQRLRQEGFDGLDMVWLTGAQRNKHLLTVLLKELQGAFQEESRVSGREALLLSTAVSGLEDQDSQDYDVRSFPQYVDFISLVTYNAQRPSEAMPDLDRLATYWLSQGMEAQKLSLGFPLYAPVLWSLENETHHEGGETGLQGDSEEYTQVCQFIRSSRGHHGGHRPSSDHRHSLRGKVRQLRRLGLGGASLWSLDLDDPSGTVCGQGSFPFTREIRSSFGGRRRHHRPRPHHHHHHRHGSPTHGDHHPGHDHCHRHRVHQDMESPKEHTTSV